MLTSAMNRERLCPSEQAQHARFVQLTAGHRDVLRAVAMRLCWRNAALAEDLVQEALLRGWCSLDSLKDDAKARPWLIKILRNCWIDHCRKPHPEVLMGEIPDRPVEVDGLLSWEEVTVEDFHRVVELLVEPYRSVVIMHDIDQLSIGSIAERLRRPYQTVAVQLHRGRKRLRELLQRKDQDGA
jgi:RNA polymerase sigma-70 factor (ECF subfamily)